MKPETCSACGKLIDGDPGPHMNWFCPARPKPGEPSRCEVPACNCDLSHNEFVLRQEVRNLRDELERCRHREKETADRLDKKDKWCASTWSRKEDICRELREDNERLREALEAIATCAMPEGETCRECVGNRAAALCGLKGGGD